MSRRKKKLLIGAAVGVGVILLAGLCLLGMVKSTPAYYRPVAMDPARIEAGAKRVEDKLIELRNVAAEARLTDRTGRPTRFVVTFTEEELNAFILKWTELNALRDQYERFIREPAVALEPGRVIFAARSPASSPVGFVMSLHAEVSLGESGLAMRIDSVNAGRLPLPRAAWDDVVSRLIAGIDRELPAYHGRAKVDPRTGLASESAVKASYAVLLRSALTNTPTEPVIIIPVTSGSGVAVRVVDLKLADRAVTLTFIPLEPPEAAEYVARLKGHP